MTQFSPTIGLSSGKYSQQQAHGVLFKFAHEKFDLPGDANFVLGGLMSAPLNREEAGDLSLVPSTPCQASWQLIAVRKETTIDGPHSQR